MPASESLEPRTASISRTTGETDVSVTVNLDGDGTSDITTGIGFLDHMLDLLAAHGRFDLTVDCSGDLAVDPHHSIEDTAIVLGQTVREAVGDKSYINRYGHAYVPMDETLARSVVGTVLSELRCAVHERPRGRDAYRDGAPLLVLICRALAVQPARDCALRSERSPQDRSTFQVDSACARYRNNTRYRSAAHAVDQRKTGLII